MATNAFELIQTYLPTFTRKHAGRIVEDTTEFMSIDYGDVIALEDKHYLVLKNITERRFGLEDPKYWVKRCKELETGQSKILKLEFYEKFSVRLGNVETVCFRSPGKESRILEKMRGDMRFMQGRTAEDTAGNNIRILDIIRGTELDTMLDKSSLSHEEYFRTVFPEFFVKYISLLKAVENLHNQGEQHGDIRRDHVLVDAETGEWRLIDFDYAYEKRQNPFALDLFGLGSILLLLVGQRDVTTAELKKMQPSLSITQKDMMLSMPYRLANLQKMYPHIPKCINDVCMHFSTDNTVFYSSVNELVSNLLTCFHTLPLFNSIRTRYTTL